MKIAVVGSGISGSSAAWALNGVHDVTLYEKEDRPGGHTATVDVDYDGTRISVDTGFIVYNEANYPNLTALLRHLDVATHASDMSFALSLDRGKLEWCGDSLSGLFAQKRNLLRPSFLRMLREIVRFNTLCLGDRDVGMLDGLTIGGYLDRRGFSQSFRSHYLVPMASAIWSTPTGSILDFPAVRFVNFFDNHRLIHRRQHPWRTITGGSRTYLEKLLRPLGQRVRVGTGALSIRRSDGEVRILDSTGREETHDRVIIATHTDQALAMLDEPSDDERAVLSTIPYRSNRVVLHRDAGLMPRRRRAWASWNYLSTHSDAGDAAVSVTYWMNRLQGIDRTCPLFVSLNPAVEPAQGSVFGEFSYDHPQFGAGSMAAQARLTRLQGENGTWFAGAWTGYGFHEDGLSSGLEAAEALGGVVPWRTPSQDAAARPAAAQAAE